MYTQYSRAAEPARPKTVTRGQILGLGVSLLLTACGGDVSDELAMDQPFDLALEQCELANVGVVGEPTDPVVIDGEEIQACVLNTELPEGVASINLKGTHRYEKLVWVLDGTYHIGESKTYETLSELEADPVVELSLNIEPIFGESGTFFYARENALVVVHRNGVFSGDIRSLDDNADGGGEWGGVVVNSFGYYPDCPEDSSADNLCNIEGEWGYFGGLSREGSETYSSQDDRGLSGSVTVSEAGGPVSGSEGLGAAVVMNAPLTGATRFPLGVFYSGASGLEINGGNSWNGVNLDAIGNQGPSIVWGQGFTGIISGVVYHDNADSPALEGTAPQSAEGAVTVSNLTLVDKNLTAGTALSLEGSHTIENVIIQGFDACLQYRDDLGESTLSNSVFYCGQSTQPLEDGSNLAEYLVASASNYYELDPDLTPSLALSNSEIQLEAELPGGGKSSAWATGGYDMGLFYEPCLGVGVPLEETLTQGPNTYQVCELEGTVASSFKFDDDINDEMIAWVLKGAVNLGEPFADLSEEEQQERLANPYTVIMNGQSRIFGRAGGSLVVNPGVELRARGRESAPIVLASVDEGTAGAGEWGGLTINGVADQCGDACAEQPSRVDVRYLRLLEAGAGGPALTLNHVEETARLSHVDITGAAAGGVLLNGGAANLDHLITAEVAGDQVAWRNGYTGTLQHAVLKADTGASGHALRGQNRADDHNATPRSQPVLANVTAVGGSNTGILLEQGTGLLLYNSVFSGFATCLDVDDEATADQQSIDPKGIEFDGVVLDCDATLVEDDEAGGSDYGYNTQMAGGTYEVPAVLDTQLVASGEEVPAGMPIDGNLPGNSANYLSLDDNWMGAVRDSADMWYAGWSDSVYVQLSAECDNKGTLEDTADFDYTYSENIRGTGVTHPDTGEEFINVDRYYKVCSLRGTLTEDFHLTAYTGSDRDAVENGGKVSGAFLDLGEMYTTDREVFAPLPTIWLLNGMVHVGEGHRELTEPAQVQSMKENPVTLTIDAASIVMATESAGLHVTRGGELRINGGPHYAALGVDLDDDQNTTGPVNLMGLLGQGSSLYSSNRLSSSPAVRPINEDRIGNWVGLIVDGFARNNQCPDAATAEPGSRVCNIPGEYGYHGGYDDEHGNVFIENLNMIGGQLAFNSVGRGGIVDTVKMNASNTAEPSPLRGLAFNGGTVNMTRLNLTGATPYEGPFVSWRHGFQGTLQHINVSASFGAEPEHEIEEGRSYPIIQGLNGDDADALPRSKPTLANLSLPLGRTIFAWGTPPADGAVIDLAQGSGLYLYNSVIGAGPGTAFYTVESPAYCFSADETSAPLIGTDIAIGQLAYSCKELSENSGFSTALLSDGQSSIVDRWDYVISNTSWTTDDYHYIEELKVQTGWENKSFPAEGIVGLGPLPLDYSSSTSADANVIEETDYLGSEDYFLLQEHGGTVSD